MIAAAIEWNTAGWLDPGRMAASAGMFAGGRPALFSDAGDVARRHCAQLAGPRDPGPRGWRPFTGPDGEIVLIEGQIDNCHALAAALGVPSDCLPARLYALAVSRWGDGADARCTGDYAAVILYRDGSVRMARSPWSAPSLFWAGNNQAVAIASVPRLLFAAGHPRKLRATQMADLLYWIENADTGHWYEGVRRVEQGSVLHLGPEGERLVRWYDPFALPKQNLASDDAYLEAANALLSEAVEAALRPASKPGLLLSGGLDSAIVASEMMRQRPAQRLDGFTFVPLPEWQGRELPGQFNSDRSRVEAFAAMHPQLEAHFCDNRGLDFDSHADAFFAATDSGRPGQAFNAVYHGPIRAAAEAGCDWIFDAALGNGTFSNDGRWAYVEFARTGKWSELWRMLRDHPGDNRSMGRRLLARSIIPQLPRPVRAALRRFAHGRPDDLMHDVTLLRTDAIEQLGLVSRAQAAGTWRSGEWFRTRHEWLAHIWRQSDMGGEGRYGIEQVFGLRHRDVTSYRPLLEFCAGVPTEQFVRNGTQRWLARRMAAGRMPEAQRLDTDYGRHNVDWHLRLSRRLPELRHEFERIADDPELARLIDADAGLKMLDHWPENEPTDPRSVARHFHALTGAVIAARFHRFVTGRNA